MREGQTVGMKALSQPLCLLMSTPRIIARPEAITLVPAVKVQLIHLHRLLLSRHPFCASAEAPQMEELDHSHEVLGITLSYLTPAVLNPLVNEGSKPNKFTKES